MRLQDGILVDEAYIELLSKCGLTSFDCFMRFIGGKLVKRRGRKEVWHFTVDGTSFYLKRRWASLWDFASAILRGGTLGFYGFKELHNIMLLNSLGIPTMKPVAAGSRWRRGFNEAFLLTEAVDAFRLDEFMRDEFAPLAQGSKRKLLLQLAALVSKLHSFGLFHQDLFLHHIAVRVHSDGEYELILLDLDRLIRPRIWRRAMIKDLAKLLLSSYHHAPLSDADRLRFYFAYARRCRLEPSDVALIRRVWKKALWVESRDGQIKDTLRRMPRQPPSLVEARFKGR
ncbi:MAG: lipopolysaccharide kinase InaA family protein [Armatimonadota bacterium]|nr:lipopolysaccharide kinase InaA family protein [Armatimonadota bacterium]MDW8026427.1 lipopolysaccharide kinase InaA family protein [Armatimonadota bacterium]